mmetsp:Transcript_125628/g.244823  ORF Transcript_125628/g.244823 Transcript_125628/m.244823 type:complete len:183 (+) Transcript_125628:40-588(+)
MLSTLPALMAMVAGTGALRPDEIFGKDSRPTALSLLELETSNEACRRQLSNEWNNFTRQKAGPAVKKTGAQFMGKQCTGLGGAGRDNDQLYMEIRLAGVPEEYVERVTLGNYAHKNASLGFKKEIGDPNSLNKGSCFHVDTLLDALDEKNWTSCQSGTGLCAASCDQGDSGKIGPLQVHLHC